MNTKDINVSLTVLYILQHPDGPQPEDDPSTVMVTWVMGELITIRMAVIAAMVGLGQTGCCGDYRG